MIKSSKKREQRKRKRPQVTIRKPDERALRAVNKVNAYAYERKSFIDAQFHGLSPYHTALTHQMLCPNTVDSAHLVVAPAEIPNAVAVRHFHKTMDITQAAFPNGFSACMLPDLFMPGYVSGSANVLVPPAALGPVGMTLKLIASNNAITTSVCSVSDDTSDTALATLAPTVDGAAAQKLALGITAGPATTWNITVTNASKTKNVIPNLKIYSLTTAGAGAWSAALYNKSLAENAVDSAAITIALNTTWVGFEVSNTSDKTVEFDIKIAGANSQVICTPAASLGPAFSKYIVDNGIVYGRVLSMSLLATNTSADFQNGGNINAGRVPNSFDPFKNTTQQLSALPSNRRYQAQADKGCYVTWIPGQMDEFGIDNLAQKRAQLNDSEFIFVQLDGWPAGASFKLQFDWIVEFYTPNQSFEKTYPPPLMDDFRRLYYMWALQDAATCNPDHDTGWRKFIQNVVNGAQRAYKFYNDHQHEIHAVGQLASSFL